MKEKFLTFLFLILLSFNVVFANEFTNDAQRIDRIGMRILTCNDIKQRLTFDFTILQNQGAFPVLQDYSKYTAYNLHNNRIVTIYAPDYNKMTSDDEVAALLAHYIAQGVNSYNGLFNGQFIVVKEGFMSKSNELKYDKQAVDYLVNAGYNPVAIITAYDKTLAEWRGDMLNRHNKADKRMKAVYNQIKTKYPQYLDNNEFTKSVNYKRFINSNDL